MTLLSSEGDLSSPAGTSNKQKKMVVICSRLLCLTSAVLLLFLQPSVAIAGEILTPPETQRIAINTGKAMFYCRTRGIDAQWRVETRYYHANNHSEDGIEFEEIITYSDFDSNIFDMYMWVPSSMERNMSQIACVSRFDQLQHSADVYLIILGGPAAPEPTLNAIESSHLTLEWNRPFTWDEHPIEHYVVSSDSSLYFQPELEVDSSTTSTQIQREEGTGECETIQFSVRANNGLADSPKGSVTGGFPIAPDMSEVSIHVNVMFNQDLSPRISLSIQLPRVCSFQDIEYKVTILQVLSDETVIEVGVSHQQRLRYGDEHTITEEFSEGLTNGVSYRAAAQFWTFAENDESISTPVETSEPFSITVRNPPTEPLITPPPSFNREYIIAITVGGGGVIIMLIVLIIVALVVCCSVRRKSRFSTPTHKSDIQSRPLPMVTNPIYEGSPVYETVGLQLSTLERPRTPTTPTSSEALINNESPYSDTAMPPGYTSHPVQQFQTESDNYTIMISPGRTKSLARQTSSPDQDVRYVPEPGSTGITSSDW